VTDPVNYERILARVDSIVEKQSELTLRLNELTATLETRYMPRELYLSHRDADRQDVSDVVRRIDATDANRAADRRLIIASLVFPLLVGLMLFYAASQIGGSPA
jgi:DNA helicase HerA-like ATPase